MARRADSKRPGTGPERSEEFATTISLSVMPVEFSNPSQDPAFVPPVGSPASSSPPVGPPPELLVPPVEEVVPPVEPPLVETSPPPPPLLSTEVVVPPPTSAPAPETAVPVPVLPTARTSSGCSWEPQAEKSAERTSPSTRTITRTQGPPEGATPPR